MDGDAIEIIQYPVLQDNYNFILRDGVANKTAIVDPSVADHAMAILLKKGWQLDYILNTHHHADHVGANRELKQLTGCEVVGYKHDASRIPGIDIELEAGDLFPFGGIDFDIIHIPGHTTGHIAYYCESLNIVFSGDTLFSMGCGRLFEGTPEEMIKSLRKLTDLPDVTTVYCAHEYTQKNGEFALQFDRGNEALRDRMHEVRELRKMGKPTVPTTIGQEKKTNPFLRPHIPMIRQNLGMPGGNAVEVFTELRKRKDTF